MRASTEKWQNPCEYRKTVGASAEKASNKCEDRKMISSGQVLKKDRIRASMEKLSGRVPEKSRISVSITIWMICGAHLEGQLHNLYYLKQLYELCQFKFRFM